MTDTNELEASFDEAFPALFRRAMQAAQRITGDPARAEDVAAEAMIRAYENWAKLAAADYREGWVVRAATNVAIDAARRLRLPLTHRLRAPTGVDDQATAAVSLRDALRSLPRRQREAVVLCHLEGYTEAEAARLLSLSPNTVRTHVHRGVAALRVQLKDFKETPLCPTTN